MTAVAAAAAPPPPPLLLLKLCVRNINVIGRGRSSQVERVEGSDGTVCKLTGR